MLVGRNLPTVAGALALTLLLFSSCTAGQVEPSGSRPSSTSGRTELPVPSSSAQVAESDRRCSSWERVLADRAGGQIATATGELTSSSTATSIAAARRVSEGAQQIGQSVRERCAAPSVELSRYLRVATNQVGEALSDRDLRTLMGAYTTWAETVGHGKRALHLARSQEWCRQVKRRVTASYRVWWRWAEKGRDWWIELHVRSRFPQVLDSSLYGRVLVTGMPGADRPGSYPLRRRNAVLLPWGGSSFDSAVFQPGESQRILVSLGHGPYVTTTADGTFRVTTVEIIVYKVRGWRAWCDLPVPERS